MEKIRISAVSYLNSLPFVYGLSHSALKNECDIALDIPSVCAEKLISGKVDVGLIPVAAIPQVKNAQIISDYCIGANGKVKTVCLFSEVPLHEIKTILLDYQSRTSVMLVKILAKEYWKINPEFVNAEAGFENKIAGTTAAVVIGDRTFNLTPGPSQPHPPFGHLLQKEKESGKELFGEGSRVLLAYDLAEEWKNFTGLPFVFACWVANKNLPAQFVADFNNALKNGLANIDKTLEEFPPTVVNNAEAKKYLTENISYTFDAEKKKALELFNHYSQNK
ncbi:MAG: Chorismate dehydratase [Bacteroidia bacterium]|nr:Chorismate dehydratase [Bacteroidia bacterium]